MRIARRTSKNADQLAHVTREMYKQNLELAERNKTLTLLRQIDEVVLGSTTELGKATQIIANLLVGEDDFSLAAIYVADKTKVHCLITDAGAPGEFLKAVEKAGVKVLQAGESV